MRRLQRSAWTSIAAKHCEDDENCFGIDFEKGDTRCFLNSKEAPAGQSTASCPQQIITGLAKIDTYTFWFLHPHDNNRRLDASRPLERRDARRLLATEDPGLSWGQMLRFNGITFSTGGTFTACFCDAHVDLATGKSLGFCQDPADYKVAVGTVHVSGVKCLLEEAKFRRGTCEKQYPHAGNGVSMRCYPGDAPDWSYPAPGAAAGPTAPTHVPTAGTGHLSSYCLYGPEEETRDNPLCQWPTL